MSHKVQAKYGKLTYDRCEELMTTKSGLVDRALTLRIANNTYLERSGLFTRHYRLTLHGKPILRFYPGGVIVLDSCGYRTTTTKARLNQFGPINVWQRFGKWWVGHDGIEFHDGLIVFDDGTPLTWLRQSVPLRPDTELGIVADYLDEQGRDSDAARVRAVVMAGLEV